jgi:hypothetical protein
MHYRSTQFQVIMRLDTLLRDGLRDTFAITALELTGEEVTKPGYMSQKAFKK